MNCRHIVYAFCTIIPYEHVSVAHVSTVPGRTSLHLAARGNLLIVELQRRLLTLPMHCFWIFRLEELDDYVHRISVPPGLLGFAARAVMTA